VAAFENLATFDARQARLSTWLLTIARNRCLNHLRRRQAQTPGDVDQVDRNPLPDDMAIQSEVWARFVSRTRPAGR